MKYLIFLLIVCSCASNPFNESAEQICKNYCGSQKVDDFRTVNYWHRCECQNKNGFLEWDDVIKGPWK